LVNSVQSNGYALSLVENDLETFGQYAAAADTASGDEPDVAPRPLTRSLRFDRIIFQYPNRAEPAVRDVSFAITAGESIGVLGPTGSGKSTLLDLMLGFLPPDSGSITVDGIPMESCRGGWQRSIGYVPQDVYLVDDSIRVNVALGWRGADIDDDAVTSAVRLAELEEVVRDLPDGLETIVGERGVRLSGGQRQRLGLARALYVRPSVLVLDEATSNLDITTERRIVTTLGALGGGLTTIVVTHRLSTIRDFKHVIYLDKGCIVFEGTFDGLLQGLGAT
jgi:ABC-type multidrug transport system fused ATPase/permease subunit